LVGWGLTALLKSDSKKKTVKYIVSQLAVEGFGLLSSVPQPTESKN